MYRLKRAVGWWRRYFLLLRLNGNDELFRDHQVFRMELAVKEFDEAKMSLLRYTQCQEFPETFDLAASDRVHAKTLPWKMMLC